MASQAAKDIKFGFWIAAGFAIFGIAAAIILGLATHAAVRG
jgi:hypothetical protein